MGIWYPVLSDLISHTSVCKSCHLFQGLPTGWWLGRDNRSFISFLKSSSVSAFNLASSKGTELVSWGSRKVRLMRSLVSKRPSRFTTQGKVFRRVLGVLWKNNGKNYIEKCVCAPLIQGNSILWLWKIMVRRPWQSRRGEQTKQWSYLFNPQAVGAYFTHLPVGRGFSAIP